MRDEHWGPGTSQGCRAFRASAVRASGAATCRRSGGSIPPGLRAHQVLGVARPLRTALRPGHRPFRTSGRGEVPTIEAAPRPGEPFGDGAAQPCSDPVLPEGLRERRPCVQGQTAPAGIPAERINAYYAIFVNRDGGGGLEKKREQQGTSKFTTEAQRTQRRPQFSFSSVSLW